MDQRNQPGPGHSVSSIDPPPYSSLGYPPPTQSLFPQSEQFGAGQVPATEFRPLPSGEQSGMTNKANIAPYPPQTGVMPGSFSGSGQAPQIGFYVPPANPTAPISQDNQGFHDDVPKFSPNAPFHDDIAGYQFSEKSIRMAFIRKVFGILSIQLAVTAGFIALFVYNEAVQVWSRQNSWFFILCIVAYFITVFTLICCDGIRRLTPHNYILLSIFTLVTSVMVGSVCSTYDEKSVLLAAGTTVVVCASLTIFAFQTKIDFTRFGGILFVALIILILFGFMTIFLRNVFPVTRMIYNALGALLFCIYLVHDIQLMIGGDHKYSISPEEYVFAALTIYLDVINIFLKLLALFGKRN